MKQIVELIIELVRELRSSVASLFRSLLIILALALYLGYLAVDWLAEHPAVWLALLAICLAAWVLRRYVFGREVRVEKDSAIIVKRARGKLESLYRGWHKLKIGDRVCQWLSLRPESGKTNEEEVYTSDEERVRLSADFQVFISDPLRFHRLGRKRKLDFAGLNRQALLAVVQDFGIDDLYNTPVEINQLIAQTINNQLNDRGLQVINYRLDEAVWPETNEHWRRNRSNLMLQAGQYWSESRDLRRRIC